MKSNALKLACELIARESVTPKDAGCLDIISERLKKCGFSIIRLPRNNVDNILAIRGDSGSCFAFAGHTDVVPAGNLMAWDTLPFEPTIKNGTLYGRGAADMKSSLAAMVVAVEKFTAAHPEKGGKIVFLLTSDEEGVATDGTVRLVEYLKEKNIKIDWCVVGEPSSAEELGDTIRVGRRGSLNGQLTVQGIQGHVAYPFKASNPIHNVMPALNELAEKTWDNGNDYYPATTFQISNINSGAGAENIIPGALTALFNFRFSNEQTSKKLQAAVHQVLDKAEIEYTIDWRLSGNPFLTAGGRLVDETVAAIKEELGRDTELSTGGGTSDGRFIAPLGIELVEVGPINANIHKVNESIPVADIGRLCDLYCNILNRMLQ
ncbi:MAG: succinyl-diaminopimelate desuccinylase [Proteobacteria bacterium]|nr:succinyl-diaminopimelate desuccinylase [Pseudomonadota bacterium]